MKVTKDFTKDLESIVKKFKGDKVLVGIPEDENARDDQGKLDGPITNAAILAINHFGSEAAHIPPRPVLSIGIKLAQDAIGEELKNAAKEALSRGFSAVDRYYERAGMIAANSVKSVINEQIDIQGPSDATLATREANGFKGDKALIVTGQLRNSITYVVKGKE